MRFIVCLECISLTEILSAPLALGEGLFLSNNKKDFSQIYSSKHIAQYIGGLEASAFEAEGCVVIYKDAEVSDPNQDKPELEYFLRSVKSYLYFLWLIKDNSIRFSTGFIYHPKLKNFRISSNTLGNPYFNNMGQISHTTFSKEEIDTGSTALLGAFLQPCTSLPERTAIIRNPQSKLTRLSIAGLHLEQARTAYDLGLRIANYCTFFECLFSTSTNELTHQLSERIALFLSDDKEERLTLYKNIKRAYQVRSSVVHGGYIGKKDYSTLEETALFCDETARYIMLTIYQNEHYHKMFNAGEDAEITDFFLNLIFRS